MKDEILAYAQGEAYPFHMPGHKRNIKDGVFPYQLDLTEIDGFDNLHHPEGYIKQIEDKAAEIYRAKRAFLLVNGATCGILAAIKAATMRGDKVIIARNCHTSVFHAVELLGLKPEFIMPERAASDIFGCVNPVKLEKLLSDNPDAKLVVITSPTYEGICSDVDSIAGICREKGVKLFVDEAHGAHFPFHDDFPNSAICCGADISVVSLHKTMPAMTQTALLLTGDSEVIQPLQTALSIFQTSSPSYVLMSSIETCLTTKWDFDSYIKRIRKLEAAAADMKRLKLLFRDKRDFSYDIGKLVISTQKADIPHAKHRTAKMNLNLYFLCRKDGYFRLRLLLQEQFSFAMLRDLSQPRIFLRIRPESRLLLKERCFHPKLSGLSTVFTKTASMLFRAKLHFPVPYWLQICN